LGDLIRRTTYEAGEVRLEGAQTSTDYGLTTTTEAARRGERAGVALLLPGDDPVAEGFRAEWHGRDTVALNVERWYGISYYLPSDWDQQGSSSAFAGHIVLQFHTSDSAGWSPIYAIRIEDTGSGPRWRFVRKDDDRFFTDLWTQPVAEETWIDFVVHVRWTTNSSGFIEFYRNGQLVYADYGIRTMNSSAANGGPYVKWGIYGQPARIFFDEVRIAEGANMLGAVSP
jgi:hypothetical protein